MCNEFSSDMTVMIIANEKLIFFCHFIMCFEIKASLKLVQVMFIACSTFWIAIKSSDVMNTHWNSLSWKIFCFENDERRNKAFIDINAFYYCNSFLIFEFHLKLLINIEINNTFFYFLFIDWKLTFIHVIYVFWFNIKLH